MLIDLVQLTDEPKPTYRRVSVETNAIKWIGEEGAGARILFIDQTDIRVTNTRLEVKKLIEGSK